MVRILNISAFKTASRCWIPVRHTAIPRHFSSRQRCVNFNNVSEHTLVSNDDVFPLHAKEDHDFESFEPTVFSSEEVHTAGPVKKA